MEHPFLMRAAIAEARQAMGRTHPNPAVGAVISHRGDLVTRGFTQPAGEDHAEVVAIKQFRQIGLTADASTLLAVTMEPCSTEGRTGPCTQAIISSGIRNVVVGTIDPNPAHAGRGLDHLRDAGITVTSGILEAECRDLNLIFNWRMEQDEPFIAAKIATTLDGRIATRGGLSKWITGTQAREDVHRWRRYFPAVGVGAGTVLADNPILTARLPNEPDWCPVRFIFDRNLITFKDGLPTVYADAWQDRTVIVTDRLKEARIRELSSRYGLTFWGLDSGREDGGLAEFSSRCREAGIWGILLEGGAHLLSSFLRYRFIHYLFAYRAPRLLADSSGLAPFFGQEPGTIQDAIQLSRVRHEIFGDDQLMRGFLLYPEG